MDTDENKTPETPAEEIVSPEEQVEETMPAAPAEEAEGEEEAAA